MPDEDDDDDVEEDDATATCDDELSIAIPTGLDVIFSRIKDEEEELMLLMLSSMALLPLRSIGRPKMQYVPSSLSTSPFMHGMYSTVEL
jgi:hypothetical protein